MLIRICDLLPPTLQSVAVSVRGYRLREPLRRSPGFFLADDSEPRRMLVVESSGTTGTPIRLRINVVPTGAFGDEHRDHVVQGVRASVGSDVEVAVTNVESIPRTSASKFRVRLPLIEGSGR